MSLKKLPFTVVSSPGEAGEQARGGDAGGSDGEDAAGGSGSDSEDELPTASGSDGEEGGSGSEGEEEQPDGSGSEGEEGDDALDAFAPATAAAVEAFAAAVESDPAALLAPTPELAGLAKAAAKALYDYQAQLEGSGGAGGGGSTGGGGGTASALPELYVEGFDAEQIWLQLELAAAPALKRARKLLKRAGRDPLLLTAEMEEAVDGAAAGVLRALEGWLPWLLASSAVSCRG